MTITPLRPHSDRQLVFTSSQAARYVGVSLATIRRWTDAGHIHCYRTPGGQRRFSRDQLDGFVTSMQNAGETRSRRPRRSPEVPMTGWPIFDRCGVLGRSRAGRSEIPLIFDRYATLPAFLRGLVLDTSERESDESS